jgi:hypothetical protein
MNKHFRRSLLMGTALVGSWTCATADSGAPVAPQVAAAKDLPPPMLDHDETVQLEKARATVFKNHPELKAENEKLKALHDSTSQPSAEQRNTAFAEWKDYQQKMRAELLKVDPSLKPVFAKIDKARKNGAPAPFQPAQK